MSDLDLLSIALYLIVVAASVAIEHLGLAYRWRRRELARRTLGIATVLGWAVPLWVFGIIDFDTWLILLFGFGVAGAVTGYLYTDKHADMEKEVDERGEALRRGEKAEPDTGTD